MVRVAVMTRNIQTKIITRREEINNKDKKESEKENRKNGERIKIEHENKVVTILGLTYNLSHH